MSKRFENDAAVATYLKTCSFLIAGMMANVGSPKTEPFVHKSGNDFYIDGVIVQAICAAAVNLADSPVLQALDEKSQLKFAENLMSLIRNDKTLEAKYKGGFEKQTGPRQTEQVNALTQAIEKYKFQAGSSLLMKIQMLHDGMGDKNKPQATALKNILDELNKQVARGNSPTAFFMTAVVEAYKKTPKSDRQPFLDAIKKIPQSERHVKFDQILKEINRIDPHKSSARINPLTMLFTAASKIKNAKAADQSPSVESKAKHKNKGVKF